MEIVLGKKQALAVLEHFHNRIKALEETDDDKITSWTRTSTDGLGFFVVETDKGLLELGSNSTFRYILPEDKNSLITQVFYSFSLDTEEKESWLKGSTEDKIYLYMETIKASIRRIKQSMYEEYKTHFDNLFGV